MRWFREEWNNPSRSDHYLMHIAQRVQQGWAKDARQVTSDMQRIEFEFKSARSDDDEAQIEEANRRRTEASKEAWSFAIAQVKQHRQERRR